MKRAFDVVVALIALLLLAPLLLAVTAAVRLFLGRHVLFKQQRPGLHGLPFTLYKFRTMRATRTTSGELLPDELRLTCFGRFLRRTSLDELPELINVLKGDMSLVGPRPLLMEYLPLYTSRQARRHEVRPGITGWAQVNGRNTITWEEKFVQDVWYVDHWSLWLDIRIMALTVWKVLRSEGISPRDQAIMEEFRGTATTVSRLPRRIVQFNVLISSAGRRVTLVRLFREALKDLGLGGRVLAVDSSRTSPAFHAADRGFQVPRCTEPSFADAMLDLCHREEIGLIVPTIDTELSVYARSRQAFAEAGTRIAVSSPATVAIAGDKVRTNRWLREKGFDSVEQRYGSAAAAEASTFPVMVKPRYGSASIGVYKAANRAELQFYLQRVADPVVEAVAPGAEYTVNLLIGRDGCVLCAVPHRRLEVRAGEVSKGVTSKNITLLDAARSLGEALPGAFGALNFQCFLDHGGVARVIEINARFGGGYPLTHQAGVNFPKWLIEESLCLPSTARFDTWEDGLAMLRYDEAIFVRREAIE